MNSFNSLNAEIIYPFVWRKTKQNTTVLLKEDIISGLLTSFDNIHTEIWINTTFQDDNGEWHLKNAVWSD